MKFWTRLDWLITLLFAALVLLFFWRILTPNLANRQSFPPGDFHAQFWAFTTHEVRELSAGRLPLWNPYTFGGAPFWADAQAAVLYPFSLLTLLLSAPWGFSLFALEVEAIFHFWLAAVFMYLFSREITHSRSAAVIAALSFTFSGYLTGYPSQQLAVLEADVWLPLILFFLFRANEARTRGDEDAKRRGREEAKTSVFPTPQPLNPSTLPTSQLPNSLNPSTLQLFNLILAGVAWGLVLLAGHPQSGHIIGVISTAYFFFLWLTPLQTLRLLASSLPRAILQWLLFVGTGLALAAIQFIPAIEYTLLSVRAEGNYTKMSGGFPITDLIQLLLPGQVSHYSPLYVGVVGLILAVWAVVMVRNRHTWFWGTTAFLTLLLSLGGNTFFYSPLYLWVPGFSIFQGQERWAFAVTFSLCVLAAYGFQQLTMNNEQLTKGRPYALRTTHYLSRVTAYLLLFALMLTILFFYGLTNTGWTPDSIFYGLLGAATLLVILLVLAWLLWTFAPRLNPVLFTTLTAGLICLDLFSVNWQTNLYPQLPEWHTHMPAAVAAIKQDAAGSGEPYRVYNEFRLYDNYGVPYEIEDLWGASPLRPSRFDELLAPPMPIERTWELLNVKYVITWRETLYLPSTIIYQEPTADDTTYVHRLESVGPRAWLVTQARIADDATILSTLANPAFDRWHIALLEEDAAPYLATLPQTNTLASPSPRLLASSSQSLAVEVESNTPALLILSETHYPGWQATVDGQPVPILRVDYALRAVPVPAGPHTVELTFRPFSFMLGAIISGLAVVVVVGLLVWLKLR